MPAIVCVIQGDVFFSMMPPFFLLKVLSCAPFVPVLAWLEICKFHVIYNEI